MLDCWASKLSHPLDDFSAWQPDQASGARDAGLMERAGRRVGPAGLLKKRNNWLDDKVVFAIKDDNLEDAARSMWRLTAAMRARQGQLNLSVTDLADSAKVRRQTVTDLLMGRTWADTRTLGLLCSVLGLQLDAVLPERPYG